MRDPESKDHHQKSLAWSLNVVYVFSARMVCWHVWAVGSGANLRTDQAAKVSSNQKEMAEDKCAGEKATSREPVTSQD